MSELVDLIARHSRGELTATPIPRLVLSQADVTTPRTPAVYYPLFCVIAKGRKRVLLGEQEYFYDASTYLIASVNLPVSGQVLEAPCLGCVLALEPGTLAAMLLETPQRPESRPTAPALEVNRLEADLLDPLLRLLRLLDRPEDIPVLAPLAEREILYRLLQGPRGEMLRQAARADSHLSRISQAINVIRQNFQEALTIEDLAQAAHMSATSFHRHFRAVTAMSPLQFQKQIRLQEARRLLLARKTDAAGVSFAVGYESPSQFSREYRRLFGAPPARDAERLRQSLSPSG